MSTVTVPHHAQNDAESDEPLLRDLGSARFSLLPLKEPKIWEFYKTHQSMFWTVEECDFSRDRDDFATLSAEEQLFIVNVLSFFNASDLLVNENLIEQFSSEISLPEVRSFYSMQALIETVHTECYSTMLQALCTAKEQRSAFGAIEHVPAIKAKHEWAMRYTDASAVPFVERLLAFAVFEGVLFSASFAAIYHFKQKGLMPGLCFSNELISRDESLHCDFATHLYTEHVKNRLTDARAHAIVGEAVAAEEAFVRESLRSDIIGLSKDRMVKYVHHVANRLLVALGHPTLFDDAQSLAFMDAISIDSSPNFFEKRPENYAKRSATAGEIALDEEF